MGLLSAKDFEPWVGKMVRILAVPAPVEILLVRIAKPLIRTNGERSPFTLHFESPLDVQLLDGTYSFDCGKGGPHTIYISGKQPGRTRTYEAIFN